MEQICRLVGARLVIVVVFRDETLEETDLSLVVVVDEALNAFACRETLFVGVRGGRRETHGYHGVEDKDLREGGGR